MVFIHKQNTDGGNDSPFPSVRPIICSRGLGHCPEQDWRKHRRLHEKQEKGETPSCVMWNVAHLTLLASVGVHSCVVNTTMYYWLLHILMITDAAFNR